MTTEQKAFAVHPNEAFVEACPGAGKTRTILARLAHLAKSLPPRHGIAVLSFTNKAIEEFKSRSGSVGGPHVLQFPGFIGTFDAFVRHFLFIPTGIEGSATKPHVVDSWESLGIEIRLSGAKTFAGPGVSLDRFEPQTNNIDPSALTHRGLSNHVVRYKTDYENAARYRRTNLNRKGYFSAHDTRVITSQRIHDATLGPALGRAIAGRFEEIIVDEAQDCNPLDLDVLAWLRSQGIRVTVVCDMDQSIYGFRDGERAHLVAFAETYANENRLTLTGNFRSSSAICSLAASLRTRGTPDVPVGMSATLAHPILLYAYEARTVSPRIGEWFASVAAGAPFAIPQSNLIILGHSERSACLASGNVSTSVDGQSKIDRLARSLNDFWAGTTQYDRVNALTSVERLLIDVTGQRHEDEPLSSAIERIGINKRILRRQALTLVMRLPRTCADTEADRNAWVELARETIRSLGFAPPSGQTIRTVISSPRNSEWLRHLSAREVSARIPYATIHNAKGGEYSAVCVVIPPDDSRRLTTMLFESWASRAEHEPKRVIYVGVTRAMHLVALAMPKSFLAQCVAILSGANIPHEVHNESPNTAPTRAAI